MSEWKEVVLGTLCERITVGHVGRMADEYVEQGVPFLRSQNVGPFEIRRGGMLAVSDEFHRKLAKSALRVGDVVVVRTGYPGTAAVIPPELENSNCADLVVITPGDDLNPHLLAAIFNSAWGRSAVSGHLVGAAQQHFNVGSAKSLRVRLPDRQTQDRLAAILCALNDSVQNNRRRIEVLDQTARAIHREWFSHGVWPGNDIVRPVGPADAKIRHDWSVRKLCEVAEITMGQSPPSKHYNSDGIGTPFHQGVTDFGRFFPSTRIYCSVAGRTARPGDALISVRAPVGRVNIANAETTIGRGLAAVRSATGHQALLLRTLMDVVFATEDSMGGGTIFKAIGKTELGQLPILQPPWPVADQAEQVFGDNFRLIQTLTFQERQLIAIRDLLLPKIVSGKIDVSRLGLNTVEASVA